jgi:hypothetical protein
MHKGVTKFRHWKDGAGAKASLFVPFLSFCVFEDTAKGLTIQYSKAKQGQWMGKARRNGNSRHATAGRGRVTSFVTHPLHTEAGQKAKKSATG